MPGMDQTGPQGMGSMTGRRMGRCVPSGTNRLGRGYGRGNGYGRANQADERIEMLEARIRELEARGN